MKYQYIKFFKNLTIGDVSIVGGKNASLGEMYQKLAGVGVRVPNGFATTAEAYRYFLKSANIEKEIFQILKGLDIGNVSDLKKRGKRVRELILKSKLPNDFQEEIKRAYKEISIGSGSGHVAVRSSATAEDLPNASFAGQQESYLNVSGKKELMSAVKNCIASLYTDRAISYRINQGFKHEDVALSVGVQRMVKADYGSSGVMFTIDTETGFQNAVIINSIYGLGENIVKGRVAPDEFVVFKPTGAILSKRIGTKELRMIYGKGAKLTKNIPTSVKERSSYSLNDKQISELAKWGMIIEEHYKRPMDIEWALDAKEKKLYIIQARPETIYGIEKKNTIEEYRLKSRGEILVNGRSVGSKIGAGKVNKIFSIKDISKFKTGEVLVTEMTDPDWVPVMKKAAAIVTDKGGRTCHAAIVSRELGIPCVVGTAKATKLIKNRQEVTVSCAEGDEGKIYKGLLDFDIKKTNIKSLKRPKTKIMMNVGDPEQAFSFSQIPNDGVGLAREEFIIENFVKIHPLALLNPKKIDKEARDKIKEITKGYKKVKDYYIDRLAEGISLIAAAFYPKDVILRFSDFKTNEYANLIGGKFFEPDESNPMLGWRGASRYYSPEFKNAFVLECEAVKKVRNEMGLKNLKTMIPFCRDLDEAKKVLRIMAENGLRRGRDGFEVYSMIEIPSNVILADQFAKLFDGFSIGSNDLTQLALGVDRDNHLVSHIYNEKNDAVKALLRYVIEAAHHAKIKIGICGQAPSDYPEFAEFLVDAGIDSISLTPDTVVKTTLRLGSK